MSSRRSSPIRTACSSRPSTTRCVCSRSTFRSWRWIRRSCARRCDYADLPGGPRPQRIADLGPFKLLDVAATRDADGRRVTLTVVNRSPDAAVSAVVTTGRPLATNGAVVYLVDGPSPESKNSFAEPDLVGVRTVHRQGTELELTFPPHSFSCVELTLQ